MSSAAASRVFVGYRRLFRARKTLFRGDVLALKESRVAIKQDYINNAGVSAQQDPVHYEGLLNMADEAVDMMLHGVVQGKLNPDSGNYRTYTYIQLLVVMFVSFLHVYIMLC
jgi:complex III assembly factor LYRM7